MSDEARDIQSKVFKALSVTVRRDLLAVIARQGPIDLKTLLESTELKEPTVRHHLVALEMAGLVRVEEDRTGERGRPRLVYSRTDAHWQFGFPVRQYKLIAEHLLDHIIEREGRAGAAQVLRGIGREVGEGLLAAMGLGKGGAPLDAKAVTERVVPALDEFGSLVEAVATDDGDLVVEMRNCVFFELAQKHHDIVCEGHAAIFETIAEALGGYDAEARACLAEGDDRCITCLSRRR